MSGGLVLAMAMMIGVGDGRSQQFTRVRSTQPHTTTLLREAYDRSPSFRGLVDTLQQSNATVSVQLGACRGGRIRSCVISVTGSERARYIWIKVDPHATHNWLLATIAHELQHAVEIVEHPHVFDAASVRRLYRTISFGKCREGLSEECETERARATERQVLEELFRTPSARR
jgi:hypothetical protein